MRGIAEAAGQEKISMSAVMRRAALREIEGERQGRMRKPPVNIGYARLKRRRAQPAPASNHRRDPERSRCSTRLATRMTS
jgi:hypothetical protein